MFGIRDSSCLLLAFLKSKWGTVLGFGNSIYVLVFGKWVFSGEKSGLSSWKLCRAVAAAHCAKNLSLTENEKAYDELVWKYEPLVNKSVLLSFVLWYHLQLTFFCCLLKLYFFCISKDLSTKNYIPIKLQVLQINLKFIPWGCSPHECFTFLNYKCV